MHLQAPEIGKSIGYLFSPHTPHIIAQEIVVDLEAAALEQIRLIASYLYDESSGQSA
jgi:hypothetical protein